MVSPPLNTKHKKLSSSVRGDLEWLVSLSVMLCAFSERCRPPWTRDGKTLGGLGLLLTWQMLVGEVEFLLVLRYWCVLAVLERVGYLITPVFA